VQSREALPQALGKQGHWAPPMRRAHTSFSPNPPATCPPQKPTIFGKRAHMRSALHRYERMLRRSSALCSALAQHAAPHCSTGPASVSPSLPGGAAGYLQRPELSASCSACKSPSQASRAHSPCGLAAARVAAGRASARAARTSSPRPGRARGPARPGPVRPAAGRAPGAAYSYTSSS